MFVMYCVNGESGSSLLIESTDSMIYEESFVISYSLNLTFTYTRNAIIIFIS